MQKFKILKTMVRTTSTQSAPQKHEQAKQTIEKPRGNTTTSFSEGMEKKEIRMSH